MRTSRPEFLLPKFPSRFGVDFTLRPSFSLVGRKLCAKARIVRRSSAFEFFVIAVIVVSSLTVGARTYDYPSGWSGTLYGVDNAVTLFFLLELIIRILAERPWYRFFHYGEGWNWFDTLIVIVSLIPLEQGSYFLLGRLLRLFRVMRLISFLPQLRLLTTSLLVVLPRIGYVALMMFVIFYLYATVGSLLFEAINPMLWGNVGRSLLTLFRIATFEDWTDVMYETMAVHPLSWTFYVSFIFLSAFVFLNMMIGIVIGALEEENRKIEKSGEKTTREIDAGERAGLEAKLDEMREELRELASRMEKRTPEP